jgi:effector-binding domain-containing protein
MGELYQQLFSYMGSAQIQPAGPPFAVYYSYEPEGNTVFETGIPVQGKSEGKGEIIYKEYPGMKVVSTLFIGAYEDMGHIYQALENYLKENKLESTGSSWEVYLTDPGEVESPDENKTLIYFPIK